MQQSTLQQLMSNEQLIPLPKYDEAFYLYSFKIVPCSNTLSHNWSLCPFVHAKEKARRRDPRIYSYQPLPCPEDRKGTNCPRADQCPYTHNVYEYWLHPQRFRTQMCQQGSACTRPLCFFAHTLEELRVVDQQSNTVVSAAQIAPAAGTVAVVPAAAGPLSPGLAGSSNVPSMAVIAGGQGPGSGAALVQQGSGVTLVQQPWMQQQPLVQQVGGNPGGQLFNQQPTIVAYQPVAVQRPSLQQPPIQDAALQQQQMVQLNNPQQPAIQQLQLQQVQVMQSVQLQQVQGMPGAVQHAPSMGPGPSGSHLQPSQQQQMPFGLSGAAPVQQPHHFAGAQQFGGSQQSWQPHVVYVQPQAQQQFMQGAAAGQAPTSGNLAASHMQGMAAAIPQQHMQVQVLQQPQQPWLQPPQQLAPGSSSARPQIMPMNPGGQILQQAGAALGGLGPTDEALQAAIQQMSLLDSN